MRRAIMPITILQLWLALAGAAFAEAQPRPKVGDVVLNDYRFETGETLPSLELHYVTLGTPRRRADGDIVNAVLLLHGTTGTHEAFLTPRFFDALYGPGKPLDLARTFLIIPDAIGAGGSSKPSDGLHARFPHYGYKDQVRAQHEMLERIGIRHLRLVLGTSMGGMETWLWAQAYPKDADGFVPIAATPAPISGRNQVWREMISRAIRNDPSWNGGDYPADKPPQAWLRTAMPLFAIMTTSAETMQEQAPTRRAAIELVDALETRPKLRDANDTLYRFESSYDFDPTFEAIATPVRAINFVDDLLNPPELLHLPAGPMVTGVMISKGTFGHETLAHPEVWGPALATFLGTLPPVR